MRTVPRLAVPSLLLALAVAAPSTAEAQFGSIMKKAKERVVEQAAKKSVESAVEKSCAPIEFDNKMLELTSERLDQVVKALRTRETAGGGKRSALVKRRELAESRLEELQNDESLQQAEESEREWKSCRDESFRTATEKRLEAMGGAASAEFMRASREHNDKITAAQARGDTARANALQDSTLYLVYYKVAAPTKADSAAAEAKCGRPPRASRRVAERDSLRREVRELGDQIREMDESIEDEVIKASGLTRTQFTTAIARLNKAMESMAVCDYSKAERDAIEARKSELETLLGGA